VVTIYGKSASAQLVYRQYLCYLDYSNYGVTP
jgi:hypothetical protein